MFIPFFCVAAATVVIAIIAIIAAVVVTAVRVWEYAVRRVADGGLQAVELAPLQVIDLLRQRYFKSNMAVAVNAALAFQLEAHCDLVDLPKAEQGAGGFDRAVDRGYRAGVEHQAVRIKVKNR